MSVTSVSMTSMSMTSMSMTSVSMASMLIIMMMFWIPHFSCYMSIFICCGCHTFYITIPGIIFMWTVTFIFKM
eukprot:UN22809